jgi:hypothetical protein
MNELNLPAYNHKIQTVGEKKQIFDPIRKKYLILTPEEWVRQNFMQFLIQEKEYPSSLLTLEHPVNVNTLNQRSDIVVYNRKGQPILIVECKAPKVKIDQKVFDQIARYNMILKVPYLIVTNGLKHFCCKVNFETNSYSFLKEIPEFGELN